MWGYIGDIPNTNETTDYRVKLTKNIDHELESEQFISRSKDGNEGVFTRKRKLTIKIVILLLLKFKSSIQRELDRFYKEVSQNDFNIREVTKGAFTQARAKLDPWAFKRLNEVAVDTFYEGAEYLVWHGMRLRAVDGTRLMLPNHPSVAREFGVHNFGPKADSPRSLAMGSLLYDPLNLITVDSQIAPYASDERDLLMLHLDRVNAGDLLLLDRGYPCFWLLFLLRAKGIGFCGRLKDNWWLKVRDFAESTDMERAVTFSLPKKDRAKLKDYPHMLDAQITCRLVKVLLENGETEVLCTSLTDGRAYPHCDIEELYHYRWCEEEAYKLLKSRIELEDFSGKTARAVRQDFHAKVFLMTLCAAYAHPIEEKVTREYRAGQNRKHDQKINRTNALATLMDMLVPTFIRKKYVEALQAFDLVVEDTREIIRPGRSNPRKKRQKIPYSMNYKRL